MKRYAKLGTVMRVLLRTVLPFLVGIFVLALVIAWLAGVFGEKIEPTETASPSPSPRATPAGGSDGPTTAP